MTYAEFFADFRNKFIHTDVSDIQEHLAFQFNIEDEECGGIFYVEVKEGQLHVEPYEYYDRHAIFIADPTTLMKIADGKTDPVLAYTTHKLRVEGDIDKALRLKDIIEKKLKAKKLQEKQEHDKKVQEKKAQEKKAKRK